jgi:hypothetical protein
LDKILKMEDLMSDMATSLAGSSSLPKGSVSRFSVSLSPKVDDALEALVERLGISKSKFCSMVISTAVSDLGDRIDKGGTLDDRKVH